MHHVHVIKDGNVNKVVDEILVDGVQYVDAEPRKGSTNLVTSGGVAEAVGESSSNLAPEYSATATYPAGSYVIHDGVLYTSPNAIGTAEDWNPAHWTQTTVAEMITNAGKYNHKNVTLTYPNYTISVSQKDYVHLSGITYTGNLKINLDADCTDAIIDLNGLHFRINEYIIKKGNDRLSLCGTDNIVSLESESEEAEIEIEGETYYSCNSFITTLFSEKAGDTVGADQSYIQIKDGFAVFYSGN